MLLSMKHILLLFSGAALCQHCAVWAAPAALEQSEAEGRTTKLQLALDEVAETSPGQSPGILTLGEAGSQSAAFASSGIASPPDFTVTSRAPIYYPEGEARSEWNRLILTHKIMLRTSPENRSLLREQLEFSGIPARTPDYSETLVVATFPDPEAAADSLEGLRTMPGVVSAEAVFSRKAATAWIPNDPLFKGVEGAPEGAPAGSQWYLNPDDSRNLGVTGWWDRYRGDGIRVNVVDTGVQTGHPDLTDNIDRDNDRDYRDDDYDPNPLPEEDHGTAVAGIIGGRGNNRKGITGIAPESTIVGVRLNFTSLEPLEESDCLNHKSSTVHISNNSWGYPSAGVRLTPSAPPVEEALQNGATNGRWGRGLIYVFSAGNDGDAGGDANRTGLTVSPYVITVGALGSDGLHAPWSTTGANLAVSTWGENITTTTTGGGYRNDFNGTSAAAPVTSGVIALMLDARPTLGWRDVQDILMRSARKPSAATFQKNRGGYSFNNQYGAGVLSGERAIRLARNWNLLPARRTREYPISPILAKISDNKPAGEVRTFSVPSSENMRVESVQLVITVVHDRRGDLSVDLISPSGATSRLLNPNPGDTARDLRWTMRSVQFWGENSAGTWKAKITDTAPGNTGEITELKLRLYGSAIPSAPGVSGGYALSGAVGQPFQHEVSATGNPSNISATGLPPGLTMDDLGGITGTPRTSGDYTVTVRAENTAGVRTNTFALTIVQPPDAAFKDWSTSKLGALPTALQSPDADPDADGLPNLVEYAAGSSPLAADAEKCLKCEWIDGLLHITWSRDTTASGVAMEAQTSTDLVTWETITGGIPQPSPAPLILTKAGLPPAPARYVRLKAVITPP